jgi:SAM-dependent methyltransferase
MIQEAINPESRRQQLVSDYKLFVKNNFNTDGNDLDSVARKRALKSIQDEEYGKKLTKCLEKKAITDLDVKNNYEIGDGNEYMQSRGSSLHEKIIPWLLDRELADVKTLSVGSGPASIELFLASRNIIKEEIVALDFSESMLETGREIAKNRDLKNMKFVEKAAADMEYENQFGQIFMFDSLHWMNSWRECISRAVKALKDEGNMYIIYAYPRTPRVLIPQFELIKTLIQKGMDIKDLKEGDFDGNGHGRVQIWARKEKSSSSKLFIPLLSQ